jgi:hypothetical protein
VSPSGSRDLAGQLAALAIDQTALRRRIDTLADQVGQGAQALADLPKVARDVRALTEQIKTLQEGGGPEPVLWDFSAMTRQQAEQAWEILITWVREVLAGVYRLLASPVQARPPGDLAHLGLAESPGSSKRVMVPACWPQHPDVVAELGWLAQAWLETYRCPAGSPIRAAADWHERYLPGVLHRITQTSSAANCEMLGHTNPPPPGRVDDAQLSEAIRTDLAHRS